MLHRARRSRLLQVADLLRRDPPDDGPRSDVLGDDRPGRDHGAAPDRDALEDERVGAHVAARFELHRARPRREEGGERMLREADLLVREDRDPGSDRHVLLEDERRREVEEHFPPDEAARAERELGEPAGAVEVQEADVLDGHGPAELRAEEPEEEGARRRQPGGAEGELEALPEQEAERSPEADLAQTLHAQRAPRTSSRTHGWSVSRSKRLSRKPTSSSHGSPRCDLTSASANTKTLTRPWM